MPGIERPGHRNERSASFGALLETALETARGPRKLFRD